MDWRSQAACLEADPELFFPLSEMGPGLHQATAALAFCSGCRVRAMCLEWALDNEVHHGVWGGTTESQRHAMRGRRFAATG